MYLRGMVPNVTSMLSTLVLFEPVKLPGATEGAARERKCMIDDSPKKVDIVLQSAS